MAFTRIIGLLASAVNLVAMFILGRRGKVKRKEGWIIYIVSQLLWLTYAIFGHLYEMFLLNFGAMAIAIENLWVLNKRIHQDEKKTI
jgi:uncharacterized membrane protein YoaK (UPF0700 family)